MKLNKQARKLEVEAKKISGEARTFRYCVPGLFRKRARSRITNTIPELSDERALADHIEKRLAAFFFHGLKSTL